MFEAVSKFADRALDAFQTELSERVEGVLKDTVRKWEKRFRNHKFKVAQIHGLLLVNVKPTIFGESNPGHIGTIYQRGAVEELCNEVEALCTAHAHLEWRIGPFETEWITAE